MIFTYIYIHISIYVYIYGSVSVKGVKSENRACLCSTHTYNIELVVRLKSCCYRRLKGYFSLLVLKCVNTVFCGEDFQPGGRTSR